MIHVCILDTRRYIWPDWTFDFSTDWLYTHDIDCDGHLTSDLSVAALFTVYLYLHIITVLFQFIVSFHMLTHYMHVHFSFFLRTH